MASIHQRPPWEIPSFGSSRIAPSTVSERFRSTKETDRAKAEAIASAIEDGLGKAKVGGFTETAARSILANLYRRSAGRRFVLQPFVLGLMNAFAESNGREGRLPIRGIRR